MLSGFGLKACFVKKAKGSAVFALALRDQFRRPLEALMNCFNVRCLPKITGV